MRDLLVRLVLGLHLALLATAAVATCPTWHTLTNGTTADATAVMDNFNVILGCPAFTGNVGVGTATPTSQLSVVGGTPSAGSAYVTGGGYTLRPQQIAVMTNTPSSGSVLYANAVLDTESKATVATGNTFGLFNTVFDAPATSANQPSMFAAFNSVFHKGSGAVSSITGTESLAFNGSTVTSLTGEAVIIQNNTGTTSTTGTGVDSTAVNSGTMTNGRAIRASIQNSGGAATITTAAGLFVDSITNTGTISTTYGVYVGTMTAGTQTNHPFSIYASDTSAWNYFGGNVGVGTTTPQRTLDLSTNGQLTFGDNGYSSSGSPGIFWYSNNTEYGIYKTAGSWSGPNYQQLALNFPTGIIIDGGTAYGHSGLVLQPSGGNVGVGTSAPATALHVIGTIRQTNCTTAGTLSANTSGDIICTSDARLKNIIGDYATGLEALMRLSPKLFTFKATKADPVETFVHAGFIAQDVMMVIPQASARQHDGYYSLDTTAILAATVNSVKQLKALNDRQASQIAMLSTLVAGQAAALRQLRAEVQALRRVRIAAR